MYSLGIHCVSFLQVCGPSLAVSALNPPRVQVPYQPMTSARGLVQRRKRTRKRSREEAELDEGDTDKMLSSVEDESRTDEERAKGTFMRVRENGVSCVCACVHLYWYCVYCFNCICRFCFVLSCSSANNHTLHIHYLFHPLQQQLKCCPSIFQSDSSLFQATDQRHRML